MLASNIHDVNSSQEDLDAELAQIILSNAKEVQAPDILNSEVENRDQHNSSPSEDANDDNQRCSKNIKPIPNLSDLSFVRLIDPIHIPSYLVTKINDRLYEVNDFYQYQKTVCMYQTKVGMELNPNNFLYAIIHEKLKQVKGFCLMAIDILTNSLLISQVSFDAEYWQKGKALDLIDAKAKKIKSDLKLSRIVWITKNPRICENMGYKKSKEFIMIQE
jgi:hypothetical protein